MNLIWILIIGVVTINVTQSKSIKDNVLDKDIIKDDVSKTPNPPTYADTRRRSINLYNIRHRENNFVVNLNPTMKTERKTINLEKYRKPFMKKLLIRDINNKDNVKVKIEVTTRRSLMQRKNFTVKETISKTHDIYAKINHNRYDWNSRNISNSNVEKSKSETNFTKGEFQPGSEENSSEDETENVKTGDTSFGDYDVVDFGRRKIKYNHIGSRNHTLFPKRNNTKYLKVYTLEFGSENKTSNVENDQNSYVKDIEDRVNVLSPEEFIKSDSTDQLEQLRKPKEKFSDPEGNDENDIIYAKEVNQNAMLNAKHGLADNSITGDMTPNDNGSVDFRRLDMKTNHIGLGKHTLFPKRNNTKYLKVNTLESAMENKTFSNAVNDLSSNIHIIEDKGNALTLAPEVIIKLDSKDELEGLVEPKENFSDQEKKDQDQQGNKNTILNTKHNVSDNTEMTIGQRFRFFTFMKNKLI